MHKEEFEKIKKIIFSEENMEKYSYLKSNNDSELVYEKLNKNQQKIYTSYKKIEQLLRDLELPERKNKIGGKLNLKRGIKGWINKLYNYLEKDGCKW